MLMDCLNIFQRCKQIMWISSQCQRPTLHQGAISKFLTNTAGSALGEAAILIKRSLSHTEMPNYKTDEIQASSIQVDDHLCKVIFSALCSPPKHNISKETYIRYFKTVGTRFIEAADYNAKHTVWGSQLYSQTLLKRSIKSGMRDFSIN